MCSPPCSCPELVAEHGAKKATVVLDRERIALAKKVVEVAKADVEAALARLEEARAELAGYRAEAERWDSETKRLDNELKRGVVNPQDVLQTTNRWKACVALRDTAAATVRKAEAELLSRRAALSKAKVDVRVAEADLTVAAERGEAAPGLGGLPRTARALRRRDRGPQRQYVRFRPAHHGRPVGLTAAHPTCRRSHAAAPIYVVDRIDIIRIFVDIPEQYADYVRIGSKANVLVRAYRDEPIPGTVTRTSWALNIREPHAPRRDRPAQPRQPALAGDVRVRQGDDRAARCACAAAGGAHAPGRQDHLAGRREDVLLDVRGWPRETDRGGDGGQRRRVDRGHQSPRFQAPTRHRATTNRGRRSTAPSR